MCFTRCADRASSITLANVRAGVYKLDVECQFRVSSPKCYWRGYHMEIIKDADSAGSDIEAYYLYRPADVTSTRSTTASVAFFFSTARKSQNLKSSPQKTEIPTVRKTATNLPSHFEKRHQPPQETTTARKTTSFVSKTKKD